MNQSNNLLCKCGCGKEAPIYTETHRARGIVKGKRARYIRGHSGRKAPFLARYNAMVNNNNYQGRCKVYLTYEEFLEFTKINECHYCGTPIDWSKTTAYNLDRKDNTKDYYKENCVVCCKLCNQIKSRWFTYEEFLIIGHAIRTVLWRRNV